MAIADPFLRRIRQQASGRRGRSRIVLSITLLAWSTLAFADDRDRVGEVLNNMSAAMRELNYRGLFTFEFGTSLDTYKIVHRVANGREYERLHKLNGSTQEIVRSGRDVECLSRGDNLLRGALRNFDASRALLENYRFNLLPDERIAGRDAIVIEIVPTDDFRYGYHLSIDKATGLPLKALLLGSQQVVLERFQFIELTIDDALDEAELRPTHPGYEHIAGDLATCGEDATAIANASWQALWLPPGFEFSGQRRTRHGAEMLSYTDGFATFSVFVNRFGNPPFTGGRVAQRGAVIAYLTQREWNRQLYSVAVVGEVPFITAQRVIEKLQPANP